MDKELLAQYKEWQIQYRIIQIMVDGSIGESIFVYRNAEDAIIKCDELNKGHPLFPDYLRHVVKYETYNPKDFLSPSSFFNE